MAGPSTVCTQILYSYYLQTTTSNAVSWNVIGGQIIGASNGNSNQRAVEYAGHRDGIGNGNTSPGL
jgi:hypothetical protein